MRSVFLILLFYSFTSAFAGGCPPWLPCGKFGNLIIADPEYGSAVAGAVSSAPVAATTQETSIEAVRDLVQRIQVAESITPGVSLNNSLNMTGGGTDAARQRGVLRHPQPWFWGYDWGQPAGK